MVRCIPADEPADFDQKVRGPGRAWLRRHRGRTRRPPPYWRQCNAQLAAAFEERCAYTAMFLGSPGTADHFVSIDEDRALAYEWSNYRYASGWINSRKQAVRSSEILDPFRVGEGWFELLLPSLQLRVSERCPSRLRTLAENTLMVLGLRDDERVLRYRRQWLAEYESGDIDLDYLEKKAPLIAQAVRQWEEENGRRWGQPLPRPPRVRKQPAAKAPTRRTPSKNAGTRRGRSR
ncbi:hypothetical protein [Archangium violaceum]|uniref:hypothetical protein n=1 Tax=Archangium violaceum TaxID=83451 RepID=UPI0036DCB987